MRKFLIAVSTMCEQAGVVHCENVGPILLALDIGELKLASLYPLLHPPGDGFDVLG